MDRRWWRRPRPTACRRRARRACGPSTPSRRHTSASRHPRTDSRSIDALREPRKSNPGSMASNSQCRSDSGTPSRMQIICIGSSAAMSTTKSNASPSQTSSRSMRARRRRSSSTRRIIRGVRPELTRPPDLAMPRIVHHVEHLAGDRQVLQQRPAVRPVPAGHRRVRHRITQHLKGFRVGRDRPEPLAVGGVLGRLMPEHRRLAPMDRRTGRAESRRRSCPDR